jgi:integrase
MSSIRTKKLSSGRSAFQVRWRDPSGREKTKQFARKIDARNFAKTIDHQLVTGDYIDPRAAKTTLDEWWCEWWPAAAPSLRSSTRDRDERTYRNHLQPRFGDTPIGRIEHMEIAGLVTALSNEKRLSPSTVHKCHQVLAKCLDAAVASRRLRFNPADGVSLPRIEQEEVRFLSPREISVLASTIDPRYRALVLFLANTGLRIGEAAALRWGQVDMLRRHIEVLETAVEVRGGIILNPPKTRAGRRRVPMPTHVCEALGATTSPNPDPEALVFPSPQGAMLRVNAFRRRFWVPARKASGLKGLRIHDLRHTAVALWIAAGATPNEIASWAGHTSVSVVLDRYGHFFDISADRVTSALDAMAV